MLEYIVAGAILLLLLACTYQMLLTSMTLYAVQRNATELQQAAMLPLARLSRELAEADPYDVRFDAAPAGVVFASPRDDQGGFTFSAAGNLNWHRYVCYYVTSVRGVSTLVRKERRLSAPQDVPPPMAYSTSWFSADASPYIVIGSSVTGFAASGFNPIRLTLTTNQSALGRLDQLQFTTQVLLRN